MRGRLALLAVLAVVVVTAGSAVLTGTVLAGPAVAAPTSTTTTTTQVCAKPAVPQVMSCMAVRRTDQAGSGLTFAAASLAGYGPTDLRSAYRLPTASTTTTVAIVDAYDDPTAEADLGTYRSQFGLAACTTANGCFKKINQNGAASPLPTADTGWAGEVSLDLDMVSAVCPTCHILLVEANSAYNTDMFAAVNRAVSLGAKFVSLSWGGLEYSGQTSYDESALNHPGVVITASTGDNGWGPAFPAT